MGLTVFFLLQLCDLSTTLVFLHRGVSEANPLIAAALAPHASPALAIAAFKLAGCLFGWLVWRTRRLRLLRAANVGFGLCVCCNLLAIVAS